MKKISFILLLLAIAFPGVATGQTPVDRENAQIFRDIPKEEIFVHYNTSLLFSGEYLYYKVYTRSAATGLLSALSKIAYVELLAEDGTQIFKHKIGLDEGAGQGDFFLPTTVPSGNYKLVAYTRWMLNNDRNFFSGDVAIVNPYRGDQRAVTPVEGEDVSTISEHSVFSSERQQSATIVQDENIQLTMDQTTYGKREQVLLKFRNKAEAAGGNYSVSVRKLEDYDIPAMDNVTSRKNSPENPSAAAQLPTIVFLPELRGELLTGKIRPGDAAANLPVAMRNVALSIPGEDYMIKVSQTNERGEFFFNLNGTYSGDRALLEIIGENKELYAIEVEQGIGIDHSLLTYNKFYISPAMEEMILQRSIYNQIENAYYAVKPDTLHVNDQRKPFYEELPVIYNLEDYTRFPTIRETFTEIIMEAAIRRNAVLVRVPVNAVDYGLPSLLIVDGVVVQDQGFFVDFPATEIKSIAVLRQNYFLGPQMFQGVVDVVTINQNFWERYAPTHLEQYELEKPQPVKSYFKQSYTHGKNEHIPDFRYQLFWQPAMAIPEEEVQVPFFTGEITGNFEIILQGYTATGTPVFVKEVFRVE